jgi:DNA-directed RNA polymerase subunit RPC12/RpoP
MRKFKCYQCGHTWELPYGEGGRGIDQTCPQCGSRNVHRDSPVGKMSWRRGHDAPNSEDPSEPGWGHRWRGWQRRQ